MEKAGRGFHFCFGILMILVIISCAVRGYDSFGLTFGIAVIAAGAAVYMFAAYRLSKAAKRIFSEGAHSAERTDRAFFVVVCIMFALQLYFGYTLSFSPITDLGYTDRAAREYCISWDTSAIYDSLPARHKHYFAIYPNNQTLLIILALIYKAQYLLTGEMTRDVPIFLNAAALCTSYIFMYKCAKLIYGADSHKPIFAAMCGVFFSVFYTYTPFYYTDSLSMPLVMLSLYEFLKAHERISGGETAKAVAPLTLCALFTSIGFQIKGSVIVLLPAYVIFIMISRYSFERKVTSKLILIAAITAAVLIFIGGLSFIQGLFHIADDAEYERYKLPITHWIMMGMKSRGGYSYKDFTYSLRHETYDWRIAANVDEYVTRVNNFGFGGIVFHFFKKAAYTWADGAYLIHYHIGGEATSPLKRFIMLSPVFRYLCSFYHFAMLGAITGGFLRTYYLKKSADKIWLLRIIFVGVFLFFELWETRSRYLVNFTPIFILLAADFLSENEHKS